MGYKYLPPLCIDMEGDTPFDEYRTGYISERYNVPDNAARALQLFELGFSTSGAAKRLPVTEGTVKKYHSALIDKIGEAAVYPLGTASRNGSIDVWGRRDSADTENYVEALRTLDYDDGVAHAREKGEAQATTQAEQIDPEYRERERPLNEGLPLSEIPKELISLGLNVEV